MATTASGPSEVVGSSSTSSRACSPSAPSARTYGNLAARTVYRRETGHLKRLRATPLPASSYVIGVVANVAVVSLAVSATVIVVDGPSTTSPCRPHGPPWSGCSSRAPLRSRRWDSRCRRASARPRLPTPWCRHPAPRAVHLRHLPGRATNVDARSHRRGLPGPPLARTHPRDLRSRPGALARPGDRGGMGSRRRGGGRPSDAMDASVADVDVCDPMPPGQASYRRCTPL